MRFEALGRPRLVAHPMLIGIGFSAVFLWPDRRVRTWSNDDTFPTSLPVAALEVAGCRCVPSAVPLPELPFGWQLRVLDVKRFDWPRRSVEAQSELMRAVTKGVVHKNTGSRKVSRLAAQLKKLSTAA